jgi:hypothetical protein
LVVVVGFLGEMVSVVVRVLGRKEATRLLVVELLVKDLLGLLVLKLLDLRLFLLVVVVVQVVLVLLLLTVTVLVQVVLGLPHQ